MDRLIEYVNWERVGWLALKMTIALTVIVTLVVVFVFALVVVAGIMSFLMPLVERFGLMLLPLVFVLLGTSYIGWRISGWIMETLKAHYD